MKILFLNTTYYPNVFGGAERSTQHLAESLAEMGHQVIVVTLGDKYKIEIHNKVKVYYLPVFNLYLPFDNRPSILTRLFWNIINIYNPIMGKRVKKIVETEKPDIVNTNTLLGFSCSVWKNISKCNIPVVHTIRDHHLLCPRTTMYKNNRNCNEQCFSCKVFCRSNFKNSKYVNAVVGISQYVLNRHIETGWFADVPNHVIHNSFSLNEVDTTYEKSNGVVRLGFIGRLSPQKGIEYLLRAFAKSSKHDKAKLLIAGEGEAGYVDYLKSKYNNCKVEFLGRVKQQEFYKLVDVVVIPSLLNEALGRSILEAYTFGVPVIGAKRGGITEIIDEGETGFLFDPDRPDELSGIIKSILDTPKILDDMKDNCLKRSKDFSNNVISEKYVKVYSGLLGEKN